MFCTNCGKELNEGAAICTQCGFAVGKAKHFCQNCGKETSEQQAVCLQCGCTLGNSKSTNNNSSKSFVRTDEGKIIGGVCAGIAKQYDMNPWILRSILIVLNFVAIGFITDIIYLIAMFALPKEA